MNSTTPDIHVDQARELRGVLDFSFDQTKKRAEALHVRQLFYHRVPAMARHCRTEAQLLTGALDPVGRAHLRLYAALHLSDGNHP